MCLDTCLFRLKSETSHITTSHFISHVIFCKLSVPFVHCMCVCLDRVRGSVLGACGLPGCGEDVGDKRGRVCAHETNFPTVNKS